MGLFDFLKSKSKNLPPLRLHNTLSGKTEAFKPLGAPVSPKPWRRGTVKMYNCGPTVYDRQHVGNMFAAVLPDTLRRTLTTWGYRVDQVINITDFGHLSSDADEGEDKMSIGLRREGLEPTLANMRTMAEKYTEAYLADIKALGVETEKIRFPRASEYIPQQIELIKRLEQKGYAYKTSDGVYFDTAKFKDYGKLGNVNQQNLQEGARVEANPEKKSPADFAMWKSDQALGWDSPWGLGFPGWHIECTAMIFTLLGEQIDIHTGGVEHIGVHHNNEIAQAESATDKQFVHYWLHNAHITIDGKKISKSLGNTVYLSDITERGYSPKAFRYWVLTGHYRTPMNFTWEAIAGADTTLKRLTTHYLEQRGQSAVTPQRDSEGSSEKERRSGPDVNEFLTKFYTAIADDLNTAKALAWVWENLSTLDQAALKQVDAVLGLGFSEAKAIAVPAEVQKLVDEREATRKNKDFSKADELRSKIEAAGWDVKDTPEGPKLEARN